MTTKFTNLLLSSIAAAHLVSCATTHPDTDFLNSIIISVPSAPQIPPSQKSGMSGGEIAEGIAGQLEELSILTKIAREQTESTKAVEKIRNEMAIDNPGEKYVMISRGGSVIGGGTFVGVIKEGQATLEPNLYTSSPFTIYPKMPPLTNPMAEKELAEMRLLAERIKTQTEAEQLAAAKAKAAAEAEQLAAAKAKATADAAQLAATQAKAAAAAAERARQVAEDKAQRAAERNGRELQREINEQRERYKRERGPFRMPGA